jgi:hypothetical protein
MNTSILFTIIEDQVILRSSKGVYKQTKLARRDGYLYAAVGSSFLRLYANGTTSNPATVWEEMENRHKYETGQFGRMRIVS